MVLVSYSGREINAKLVYYGPGLSGKTTNLEAIYAAIPESHRGKMVSMKTKTERTLFFDFLPIQLGELSGFKTRFLLYTVPGQVYYNATRKLVLKGVDAVVFVADSKRGKMDENLESLQNLEENLKEHGLDLDTIPWVIQYNKRDLPDAYTIDELERALNPRKVPSFEASAKSGEGVIESFKTVSRMLAEAPLPSDRGQDRLPGRGNEGRAGRGTRNPLGSSDGPTGFRFPDPRLRGPGRAGAGRGGARTEPPHHRRDRAQSHGSRSRFESFGGAAGRRSPAGRFAPVHPGTGGDERVSDALGRREHRRGDPRGAQDPSRDDRGTE